MKVFDYICKSPKFKYFFKHPTDNILFFDIETTGLSPNVSSLYMIGVMFFDNSDGNWHLKQFFAEIMIIYIILTVRPLIFLMF